MTTAFEVSKRQRRAFLLCGAAIGMLASAPGWAQTVPVPTAGGSGGAAITNPTASSVDVDLLGTNRLIKWDSFNLGTSASASETVNFRDSNAVAGPLAALNLIDGASGASQIFGRITSAPNISVWLSNPSGILFGQTGAFSGGSLVLTTATLSADSSRFDATTGPIGGTVGLTAMPSNVGVTVAGTTANGGTTGLNVAGSLIIAAQVVDVRGRVSASGDVALVAARSVDVPADLGSNVSVTINEGTTLGSLSVGANGQITAGRILAGGAANMATNLLLGIDAGATLTASATNGKVIIAAGTTSGETLTGPATRAITVTPAAATSGAVAVTHDGAIVAGSEARIDAISAITGTASGGGISGGTTTLASSGGGIDYAGSLTGASGVAVTSGSGNIALRGAVTAVGAAGTGGVTISAANAVILGDAMTARTLRADGDVSVTALNGAIGTLGSYTIQSGLGTVGSSGITIDQRGTGAINLGGSIVRAGTEAVAGDGIFRGAFTIANTTGTVTLGTVDAASVTLPAALPADLIAERITTRDGLTLGAPVGAIRIDTAESLAGNVSLVASSGAVSGRAIAPVGDGRLIDGFGRTTIRALTNGSTITVTAGQGAQLAALTAGTVVSGATASGVSQINVGATAIDLLTASAATGNIGLTATGLGAAGTVRGTSLTATLGSVTVSGAGAITGQLVPTTVTAGIRAGSARAGTLLAVDAAGNARLGTIDSSDAVEVKANGSITGLALADVAAGSGLVIAAGTSVSVGSSATRPIRVALGAVAAGAAVDVFGTAVSAQTIDTPGAVTLDAGTGLSVDAVGGTTRASSIALRQSNALVGGHGTEDAGATLFAANETLSPAFGGTTLVAGGALRLFAGGTFAGGTFAGAAAPTGALAAQTVGLAQIASASGGTVTMAGRALTIGQVASTIGALDLTASAGGLYLAAGTSSAKTSATLTKTGATGPLDADEIRLLSSFTAGNTITVSSATDVRGVSLTSTGGSIGVTGDRSVTGLKLSAAMTDGRLDAGHARLGLTATGATTAMATVAATNGVAQLGTVLAGAASSAVSGVGQIRVTGGGVDVSSATTFRGNLILKAGAGGLRLGTGIAAEGVVDTLGAAGLTSSADAQIGSLTAQDGDLRLRVDGTLSGLLGAGGSAPTIAGGLTLGTSGVTGALALNGSGDIVLGGGSSGSASIISAGNVRIGSLAATDNVTVQAAGSVTGLSSAGLAAAAPGANLSASGSILLPAPSSAPGGVAAVLGTVTAGQAVAIKAGAVSAGSISAGTSAGVTASSGAVVGSLTAASGSIQVTGAIPSADSAQLAVDATGALRAGFGFATITTADAKFIDITATNGVAQLGTIRAGTTNAATGALGGTIGQVVVDARAITAQRIFANNGSLRLTARGGDLYLGTPADGAGALVQVAGAGDRALLDKQGSVGLITINGQLTAGGSNVALVGNDDGVALLDSVTSIRGRKVVSNTGDVRLRAVDRVDALLSGTAPGPGVTIGTGSVGGVATLIGGDLRIGSLTSATAIDLSAGGLVTGLAGVSGAGIALPFDLSAARDVTVGALAPAPTLGSATLGTVRAGRDLTVGATTVSIADAGAIGAATLSSASGLFVGALSTGGNATLTDAAAGVAATTVVPDDVTVGNEALAPGFGFADLTVNNAGTAGAGAAGTIVVAAAGGVAQLGSVTAGLGTTPLTDTLGAARDQIRVTARGITATTTTSRNGGITLRATDGGLYADAVSAGSYATLRKLGGATGGGNELRVRSIIAGTTDAIGANRGEVIVGSNTDARIGAAISRTGSIAVTATDVTGLLRATAAAGTDLQILPGFDAANLFAPGVALAATTLPVTEPMQRITVTAAGLAKLGILDAGRGTTVAGSGVTVPQIGVTAVAMDVGSATARNGDLALSTTTGRLRLGSGTVARAATLTGGSVVGAVTDAEIGSLTAGTDLLVNASGQVTGLKAVGDVVTIADGLRIGTIAAGGPDLGGALRLGAVTISGAGNVRLGDVGTTGALDVAALGGSVTGLAGAVTIPAPAVTLLKAGRNVRVEALGGSPRLGTAAITAIDAGRNASVNATRIAVGTTVAGADVTFRAGTALAATGIVGAATAAGTVTATTDAAGTDTLDNAVIAAATPVLATGFGAANLTARNATGVVGTVTVTAANVAQLGAVRAGVGSDGMTGNGGLLTTGGGVAAQVQGTARAVSIDSLLAFNGGTNLQATSGDLWLDRGDAGGYARLIKTGATGAVILGTLTSGNQPTSAAPILGASFAFNGGTALVDSTTSVRGNAIRSATGDVLVRAVTAVTGRSPIATGVAGDLTIGDVRLTDDAALTSGGTLRIDSLETGGNVTVNAPGSVTGTNGFAGAAGIDLTAARGVDVDRSRNGSAPLALAALGTVSAGAPVRLEDGTTIAQSVRVRAGQISATGIAVPGGIVSLWAGAALNVGTIVAAALDATTTGSNGDVDNGVPGVADNGDAVLATRFAGTTLATGYRDARLIAGSTKTLSVTAGLAGVPGGVAQLGPIAGGSVDVTANAMTVRSSQAATANGVTPGLGALTLTSRTGALYLQSGTATGAATLRKNGTTDEVRIGTLSAATVDADSVTNIRAGTLTATGSLGATPPRAELALVARSGAVTGLGLATAAGDGRLDTGFDRAILSATAANARIAVTAATRAQLGSVSAGTGGAATTAFDQIVVTARDIDAATLRPDASVAGANTTFSQRLDAANGNVVLTATDTLRLGSGSAAIGATLTAGGRTEIGQLTARTGNLAVVSTGGAVSGLAALPTTSEIADGRLLTTFGRATLTAAAAGRSVTVLAGTSGTSTTANVIQLGSVAAGAGTTTDRTLNQIVLRGGQIDAATASGQAVTAANGNVVLEARTGRARLGAGTAGGGFEEFVSTASNVPNQPTQTFLAGIRAATTIEIGAATATTGDVLVTSTSGNVAGLALSPAATDGRLLPDFQRGNLTATQAGRRVIVSAANGTVQLGALSAGAGDTGSGDTINVTARGIDLVSASANNGALTLAATAGDLRLQTGNAATSATLSATSTAVAGTSGNARLGTVNARGGSVLVTSSGDTTGLRQTDGSVGAANLDAKGSASDVIVTAGPLAQLGTVRADRDVTVGAGSALVSSGTAGRQLSLGAISGQLTLVTGSAGTDALLDKRGTAGNLAVGTSLTAGRYIVMTSQSDVDLGGPVSATGTGSSIAITNTGANATAIGVGAATGFALTDVEVNRLAAPTILIDSKATGLTLSTLAVGTNTTAATKANTNLALLGTGAVTITGPVSTTAGAGRTLQIGGVPAGGSVANGVVVPTAVAASITANLDGNAGIAWAGGTIDLQANRIVFGDASLRGAAPIGSTAAAIALLVSNPQSVLYRGALGGRTYLTASRLNVTYGNYALFQNSGVNSAITGGVALGTLATPSTTALRLASSGDNAGNAFALFGSINGLVSTAAALQGQPVIDYSTGSSGNVRVTLSNSRVNGCPIGSAGAGCLASTPSLPPLSLFDERQVLLFRTDDNPDLQFEPLIGTNNEGLIGDLATGAASSEPVACPTGKEASCPQPNEVKP